jgi:hypothetical protein
MRHGAGWSDGMRHSQPKMRREAEKAEERRQKAAERRAPREAKRRAQTSANGQGSAPAHYDLDAVVAGLRATAASWVPSHFRNGKHMGDELRLANEPMEGAQFTGGMALKPGQRVLKWILECSGTADARVGFVTDLHMPGRLRCSCAAV